jgi:hypothetical protein
MAIEDLLRVVAPPDYPPHPDPEDRAAAEKVVGLSLPEDYIDFATAYGTGSFSDRGFYFWVWNPLRPDYPAIVEQETAAWRAARGQTPEEFEFDIHPDRPSYLPLGADVNGGWFAYVTRGEPDAWPVAAKPRGGAFERFDMPMTTFLAKVVTRVLRPGIFAGTGFPRDSRAVTFVPGGQFRPHRKSTSPEPS